MALKCISEPAGKLAPTFHHRPQGSFMKICIDGAGAIGGYLGVQFARAGADVSLVARGAHLAALVIQRAKMAGLCGADRPAELNSPAFA